MPELTEKLFYEAPYDTVAQARIDSIDQDEHLQKFVTLNRTLFHPQGGGQKGDRGSISLLTGQVLVVGDTRKDGDVIRHYLAEESVALSDSLAAGLDVELRLDWPSRYQQMRIHSASHLIHCFLEQVVGQVLPAPRQSPLGPEGGENHYDYADLFDEHTLEEATDQMNQFISNGNHAIVTVPDDERGPDFRWWKCEGWSIPCGGVHPRDAAEVGIVSTSLRVKKAKAKVEVRLAT